MRRLPVRFACLVLLLGMAPSWRSASGATRRTADDRPNILLIVSDDQTYATFNATIAPRVFGDLVGQGTMFTNAYVDSALCCPSRSEILTGLFEQHTGVDENFVPLDRPTIVEALHESGYRTGLAGKYLNSLPCDPRPEFDQWVCQYQGLGPVYKNPILNVNGSQARHDGYTTDILASYAADFIAGTPSDQPFFAMYTPISPHLPAADSRCRSTPVDPYRPPSFDEDTRLAAKPSFVQRGPLTSDEIAMIDSNYAQMSRAVMCLDPGIGTVLDALGDRAQNTFVIYLSDNGYQYGEHRRFLKADEYDGSVHMPFIVRYPPLTPPASTSDAVVENVDIAPTLAELAGLSWGADGTSLLPLLDGRATSIRPAGLIGWCEGVSYPCILGDRVGETEPPSFVGAVDGQYKYVEYVTDERELYDLVADPFELTNLADDPAYAAVQADMASKLAALVAPPLPETTLVSGPSGVVGPGSYRFRYFTQSRFATYRCRLDVNGVEGTWSACPMQAATVSASTPGAYVLNVQATDEQGVQDPTPATRAFEVTQAATDVSILTAPPVHGSQTSVAFTYASSVPNATFECRLGIVARNAFWSACPAGGQSYGPLANGAWEFQVRAVDAGTGQVSDPPAQWSFSVDTTAPRLVFSTVPAARTNHTDGEFRFVPNEALTGSITCRIDTQSPVDCTGGVLPLSGLARGNHKATFAFTDEVGNPGSLLYRWTVDDNPPNLNLTADVGAWTNATSVTMTLGTKGAAVFHCQLDDGPVRGCASPALAVDLADGPHTFAAYAVDQAGNASETKVFSWNVDTVAPVATILSGPSDPSGKNVTFDFSADEASVTYGCSLDGAVAKPCAAHFVLRGLPSGPHSVSVVATDLAGNVGPAASWNWTVG